MIKKWQCDFDCKVAHGYGVTGLKTGRSSMFSGVTFVKSMNCNESIEDCSLAAVKEYVEFLTSHFRMPLEAK